MKDSTAATPAKVSALFSVECTTCKAKLKVRSKKAIGQILACPKCNSMVMIAPPPDWQPEGVPPVVATAPAPEAAPATSGAWKLWGAVGISATVCIGGLVAVWANLPEREMPPAVAVVETTQPEPTPELPPEPVAETEEPTTAPEPETPSQPAEEIAADPAPVEAPEAVDVAPQPAPVPEPPVEAAAAAEEPVVDTPEPAPMVDETSPSPGEDLMGKLQAPLAGIDEPKIALADLAALLSGLAACPIVLDDASLRAAGVSGETETPVQLDGGTIGDALQAALEPHGLHFEPRGKSIVIFAGDR